MKYLVLGGVRSGKSVVAEQLAAASSHDVVYIATAQCLDAGMQARVLAHQARRPDSWQLVEAEFALASAVQQYAKSNVIVLVDCLSMWLSNWLLRDDTTGWQKEKLALLSCLESISSDVVFVSNEVGFGGVSANALARQFADELGELNQQVALKCDCVELVVAGQQLRLKG